jgi:hypothetical protein
MRRCRGQRRYRRPSLHHTSSPRAVGCGAAAPT